MARVPSASPWGTEGAGRMGAGSGASVTSSLLAVFGMVPFLTSILNTMLPMLGMAKHDTMRVVFCCGKMVSTGRGWVLPAHSLAFCLHCPFGRGRGSFRRRRWAEQLEEG